MNETNQSPWKRAALPWLMWGAGALFYFYEFFVQVSPNVMMPELLRDFAINATALGVLASVYFWSYAGLQIPAGLFLDLLGPRRLVAFAATNCAVGCILFGMSHSFMLALFARLLIGVGSAFAAIGCLKLAANWFPTQRFAMMTGLTVMVGMLGAIMGQAPLAYLVEIFDWRQTLIYLGLLGFVLALIFLGFVRDHSEHESDQANAPDYPSLKQATQGLCTVFRSRQIWLAALYGSLMFAPTLTFGELWGASFLMLKYDISRTAAAGSISLIFVGWAIASPIGGLISDKIGRRLPPMMVGTLGALITMSAFLYLPNISLHTNNILMFLFGIFSAGFLPAFSIVRESSPRSSTATALGFMNMMNMIGMVFTNPIIGYMLDTFKKARGVANMHLYSLADYERALSVLPLILLLALFIVPFIKETYCRYIEE